MPTGFAIQGTGWVDVIGEAVVDSCTLTGCILVGVHTVLVLSATKLFRLQFCVGLTPCLPPLLCMLTMTRLSTISQALVGELAWQLPFFSVGILLLASRAQGKSL